VWAGAVWAGAVWAGAVWAGAVWARVLWTGAWPTGGPRIGARGRPGISACRHPSIIAPSTPAGYQG
jgi:hypothetical protein